MIMAVCKLYVFFVDRRTTWQMKGMNALFVDFLLKMLHPLHLFIWNLDH